MSWKVWLLILCCLISFRNHHLFLYINIIIFIKLMPWGSLPYLLDCDHNTCSKQVDLACLQLRVLGKCLHSTSDILICCPMFQNKKTKIIWLKRSYRIYWPYYLIIIIPNWFHSDFLGQLFLWEPSPFYSSPHTSRKKKREISLQISMLYRIMWYCSLQCHAWNIQIW